MNLKEISTLDGYPSSGVVLTMSGEHYCLASLAKAETRKEAEQIIEGCLDLIERLLAVIDQLDGDADLEPDLDGEEDDPAEDNGDREPDGDDELNHQPLTLHRAGGAA